MFTQPDQSWPRPPAQFLTMQVVATQDNGTKVLSFKKSKQYEILQVEFKQVQATMSIENMMQFLRRNFYHHESLLYFADFLRLQGKFTEAFDFLERCIFAFEYSFTNEFQPVPPQKVEDYFEKNEGDHFVP